MAYRDEREALYDELDERPAPFGYDVVFEYHARLLALQSLYAAGWDRELKQATYRGHTVPIMQPR